VSAKAADEAEWIGRCRAGDMTAWRQLYEQHLPLVHRLAQRMGVAPRDMADVCQEVFFRVYRKLGSFRGEAQFSTWLFRITLNEIARAGRANSLRGALASLLGREPFTPVARPDDTLARAEALHELQAILARMRPKHRAVFVLFELEELGVDQIAAVLECPPETVKSRLRHARADFDRLRRQGELVVIPGGRP
jgi:RNA polymerase sigma-70 factor (ECF subfamily)